jgi:hypothetical protein
MRNWVTNDSLSPSRSLYASQISAVARSPSAARHGSPGMTRASANVRNRIPKRTGIELSSRRATKRARRYSSAAGGGLRKPPNSAEKYV